jgi:predicted Zn-dependent protease
MKHTLTSQASVGAPPDAHADAASAAIFLATLERCASREGDSEFGWLLPMGRALGLADETLLTLTLPYPHLAAPLRRQLEAQGARATAARADARDNINLWIAASLQHLATSPHDQEARLGLCRALIDRGEIEAAEALSQRGVALGECALMGAIRAELLMARGRFEEAYAVAMDAVERAPLQPEVLITFAECGRWVGLDESRREALERALELHADHPLARSRLLECPNPAQPPEVRLTEAQRLLREHPARHRHHALVIALLDAGRASLAVEEARRLLRRHPQSVGARLTLSRALFEHGELRESAERLSEVMEALPLHPDALWLWARLAFATANLDALEASLERLSEVSLSTPSLALRRLELLAALGQDDEVLDGYARLAERHPRSRGVQRAYARYLIAVGLSQEAVEVCEQLLKASPADQEARALAAEACALLQDVARAKRHLKRCSEHPRAQLIQGRLDLAGDRLPAARKAARALMEWNPADADALELAIQCAAREPNNAEALLSLYGALNPERVPARSLALFAFLFGQIGELDEAHGALDALMSRYLILPFEPVYYACEAARATRRADVLLRLTAPPPQDTTSERGQQLVFYRAVGLWFDGQLEEGYALLEGLSQRVTLGVDPLIALCVWSCELGRADVAASALARLIELDPAEEQVSPPLMRQLQGRVVLLSPRAAEARGALYELIEWAGEQGDDEVLRVLGWGLDAGLASEVIELAEDLLARSPERAPLWLTLARAHRDLTQRDAALYAFERWRALSPPEQTAPLLEWAELLERDGQLARAQETLDALCASAPEAHTYRLERALFLVRADQLSAAEAELWALIEVARAEDAALSEGGAAGDVSPAPVGPAVESVLSLTLSQAYHSADLSAFHALVERLIARLGELPTLRGFLGLTLRALGDHDASLEPLKEGAAHDPYFGSEYAHALWESGARREAVGVLLECVATAPDLPEHHEDLVHFLLELDDPQGAFEHLLNLLTLTPDADDLDALSKRVYEALGVH